MSNSLRHLGNRDSKRYALCGGQFDLVRYHARKVVRFDADRGR
jgi:hypothetical protein